MEQVRNYSIAVITTSSKLDAFGQKLHRACIDNPDLPRAFVRSALLSLSDSERVQSPFILHSRGNRNLSLE